MYITVLRLYRPKTEYFVLAPALDTLDDGIPKVYPSQMINRSEPYGYVSVLKTAASSLVGIIQGSGKFTRTASL